MRILFGLLFLTLGACSQGPGSDVVKTAFEQSVHELPDSHDDFEIISIKKTDGKDDRNYLYFYQAEVKFPNGFRAHCLTDVCMKYVPLGVTNNLEPQPPGTVVTFRGVLEFEKRESGWVPVSGHLPDVVSVSQATSASTKSTSQPTQASLAASRPGQRGPLIAASLANGNCEYQWEGSPVMEPQLLDRGVSYLKSAVDRVGGPANVTEENMPVVDLQFTDDIPYRCVRATLAAIMRSGYAKFRIDNPRRGTDPWAQPLVFSMLQDMSTAPPPIDPVKNLVSLSASGSPTWNGTAVNFVTLRQYCDLTQTMNPVPLVVLDIRDAAPYRQVRSLLEVLWRSRASGIEMKGSSQDQNTVSLAAA
jgi:hypothetical protein